MVKVRFKLYAHLREAANSGEIVLEFEKSIPLKQALEELSRISGGKLDKYVFDEDRNVRNTIIFVVNGRSLESDKLDEFVIDKDSEVAIFPPFSGGRT